MSSDKELLEALEAKYLGLSEKHRALQDEIASSRRELKALAENMGVQLVQPVIASDNRPGRPVAVPAATKSSGWEKYVGEQLLSMIGIAILIIGVGIGAKYAIDRGLLGPAMRIFLGYVVAGLLGFFAWRFHRRYNGFSAVLMSGAMAVSYFITYAAYSFYALIPYIAAFMLLLAITVATVIAALRYNRIVIAHIGLIGAYILPALISRQATHLSSYLIYMAVINAGILIISFLRDWKSLFHVAFWWTMITFPVWFLTSYDEKQDAGIALFASVGYFLMFHTAALAYQLRKKQHFTGNELFLVIPNVLVFVAIGTYITAAANWANTPGFYLASLTGFFLIGVWAVFRNVRKEDELLQNSHLVMGIAVLLIALSAYSSGHGALPMLLRYIDFFAIVGLLVLTMRSFTANTGFVTLLHLLMIWALSVEITSLLTFSGNRYAYRLTLSLVWGIYALFLLFTGMKKDSAPIRITAMTILGITLGKIFFFDVSKLTMLSKTVLFMGIGGMLLLGAYFYQRYRRKDEETEEKR
jgi:uncharacterized membrane protein